MNRKTILLCFTAMFLMIVGIGVAVAFLYSDSKPSSSVSRSRVSEKADVLLLKAVPSDAALVLCLSDAGKLWDLRVERPVAVSLHYAGNLFPLYVFDAGEALPAPSVYAQSLIDAAEANGMYAEYVDCSSLTGVSGKLAAKALVLVSKTETIVRASLRHMEKSVSVLDAKGFDEAIKAVDSGDRLFISNLHSARLLKGLMADAYSRYSSFFTSLADWSVFNLSVSQDKSMSLAGTAVYDRETSEYMTVLSMLEPAEASYARMLPAYTVFASSVPVGDIESYMDAYKSYMDSRQKLSIWSDAARKLKKKTGMAVEDYSKVFQVEEAATAVFKVSGTLEKVNLIKVGSKAYKAVLGEKTELKNHVPVTQDFRYGSYLSNIFGDLFHIKDETCFTFMDGWIISGSRTAVEEYVSGRALDYTLAEYLKDASYGNLLSENSSYTAYFSLSEARNILDRIFRGNVAEDLSEAFGSFTCCPISLSVNAENKDADIRISLRSSNPVKRKAPVFEHDNSVDIPTGPFMVKNSGTGRMNQFYQNSHLALCLAEENGKGLWGVPFGSPICGCAQTLDYFANGKLQIMFASGSKIYLIDRLGRFVNGFPVDVQKEILIGPDVYDFNGTRKYNIMVLHKDNTIEMYNLKGQKPASWKTISAAETIKSLPEMITVGGNSFWVVRTSIRTLVFPFYGGEPLTVSDGDKMIRPDSEITVVDASSVRVHCYDGKDRVIRLK